MTLFLNHLQGPNINMSNKKYFPCVTTPEAVLSGDCRRSRLWLLMTLREYQLSDLQEAGVSSIPKIFTSIVSDVEK